MDKKVGEIKHDSNRNGKTDENGKQREVEMDNLSNIRSENMDGKNHCVQLSDQEDWKYVPGRGLDRYYNSMKNFKPIRSKKKDKKGAPIDSAGFFSVISFSWLSEYMYKAYKKGLSMEELPSVSPYDTCSFNTDRLELLWEDELAKMGPEKASFVRVAWRFCRTRFFASCIIFTCSIVFGILNPTVLMQKLLEYVQSGDGSYWEGLKWVSLLTSTEILRSLFFAWSWGFNYRTGLRLRSACLTLLYRKLVRVNHLGNKSIGEVINLFSNDAQRIFDMTIYGPTIIGSPIMTAWAIFYILMLLSPMALLGILVFLFYYVVQYVISALTTYFRRKAVKIADGRIRIMNEILDCIKLIKMYAWENRFSQKVLDLRKQEEQVLVKSSYCQSFGISMAPTIPVISATITFLAHVSSGNNLTAAQAFPLSAFFGSHVRQALIHLREGTQAIVDSVVAFNRIKSILLLEDSNCSISTPIVKSQAIVISHGTFAFITFGQQEEGSPHANTKKRKNKHASSEDKSEKEKLNKPTGNAEYIDILFDISFEATKGKLVGICGHVGSGKSSLLLAALGQLRVSEGQVMRDGSCAYVSQQAWIINATLRDNILFGNEFDQSRYYKAIHACNLSQDISIMPGGDMTEIGERGVNLSGGQKQRVALARALYADQDIYFLDDPLSAVDACVGSYIFEHFILGALADKTVLFVTHQIQYLNRCDDIYMMHDGKIIEHGTHDELMKMGNEYALMVSAITADSETKNENIAEQKIEAVPQLDDNVAPHDGNLSLTATDNDNSYVEAETIQKLHNPGTQLTVADNVHRGSIKPHTYHAYVVAAGGYFFSAIVLLVFILTTGSTAFSSWWLAMWIKEGGGVSIGVMLEPEGVVHTVNNATIVRNNVTIPSDSISDNPDFWYYHSIYGGTIGVILFMSILRSFLFTKATIGASTNLHNQLFKKIVGSPMRFFDTTPTGRIQHLFSRDMDEVDSRLPITLTNIIQNILVIFFAVLVICMVFPWFLIPLCILTIIYYFVSKIFRVAVRDLKRLENKSRGPIISFVTATVQGLSTIHAYGKEADFKARFMTLFDENGSCLFLCSIALRWLAVRIDAISVAVTTTTALLVISLQDQVPPALAGLALSYSVHISNVFQLTIRTISDTEVRFISVETINHYLRTLKIEGGAKEATLIPPASWPAAARIKFTNVSMAYGEDSPLILKSISLVIDAGEKIGIVGRTGSGKSSLTVALFRLVELVEGKIEIDDVNISEISLDRLRSKLSIIPQDPILFSGSIRSNLDPFKLHTDAEIWQALEKTELKDRVQLIAGQLDASVGFGGDNLSVGERQLLCLSRALLRDSKILILDEATASVDPETEVAVQKTIQQEFSDCTILTIAHRLQTVLSLDRILVMDDGKVLEFDTPSNLLNDQSSELSRMLAAAEQAENE